MFHDVDQIAKEPNAIGVFATGDCLIQGIIMAPYFKDYFPASGSLKEKLSVYIIFSQDRPLPNLQLFAEILYFLFGHLLDLLGSRL